jgi:hypothetical protein
VTPSLDIGREDFINKSVFGSLSLNDDFYIAISVVAVSVLAVEA